MVNVRTNLGDDPRVRRERRWFREAVLDSRYVADPEWLIGLGRLVTAGFAVIALYFDPTQPGKLADEARLLTLIYFVFSVLALMPIRRAVDSSFHLLTHGIDLVTICLLLNLTDELTSPFFAFFHFTLFAATIRWGLTGALLGAVVLEVILLVIGIPDLEDGVSELNVVIMRSGYFLVAAFMLGYFGAYRNRSRDRLARLAAWPRVQPSFRDDAWLRDILDQAMEVLGAARLVVVWQDVDQPGSNVAICSSERFIRSIIRDHARSATFDDELVEAEEADGKGEMRSRALVEAALATAGIDGGAIDNLSEAGFASVRFRGRLFVIDARYPNEEIGSLANIIASRISYELERMALMHEIATSARVQERIRLSRDLHDSVLQDLTAARLKLKGAIRQAPEVEPLVRDAADIIADQQRRIRHFVEGVRPGGDRDEALPATLAQHVDQLERQWDCEIHLSTHPEDLSVSGAMSDNLAQIISEATSNAVRHGAATRIDMAVTQRGEMLQVDIADNGTGIIEQVDADPLRPLSLVARVADLAGRLSVVRRRPGFALLIELPST